MRAQKPFYISAYGIIRCNLENFVGVSEVMVFLETFQIA